MSNDSPTAFKDARNLANWTKILLYAQIVAASFAIVSGVLEFQLLSHMQNGSYLSRAQLVADANTSDARRQLIGIVQIGLFVVGGILTLMWIYRSNHNARQLGASDMRFSPGWSVGWYFVPLLNLWKPYQAMKEIWKASANPINWQIQPVPSLLPWWWFFFIISNLFGNASFRLAMKADSLDQLIVVNIVTQIADISSIPLCLIFIAIINRVQRLQASNLRDQS